ncbi:MAG TPA: hypothetical protein VFR49_02690, partial [Solirubrobacteraceae bacterium]|nr:hypothetical protein [Solirubrobacteraceae bacterium]
TRLGEVDDVDPVGKLAVLERFAQPTELVERQRLAGQPEVDVAVATGRPLGPRSEYDRSMPGEVDPGGRQDRRELGSMGRRKLKRWTSGGVAQVPGCRTRL